MHKFLLNKSKKAIWQKLRNKTLYAQNVRDRQKKAEKRLKLKSALYIVFRPF